MILIVTILTIVLVSSSIYAYYWSLPQRIGPRVSLVSPPLEFSLQLEKTTFASGENISVSISLRNISNQTIELEWPEYGATGSRFDGSLKSSIFPEGGPQGVVLDFFILDQNGTLIYKFIGRLQLSVISRTLAPEEVVIQTFIWNQLVLNRWSDNPPLIVIPSGTYYIKASTLLMRVSGWEFLQQPETSSIAIQIL